MPAAIDTMPAHVTDSGPDKSADDDRVATDAAGQPAIVDPAIPLVALPTITAALDSVATPPAGKAPARPPRFAAPLAIDRSQTPAPVIDRKSTRLNSSHSCASRLPSSA